jgi:hypothetical protein
MIWLTIKILSSIFLKICPLFSVWEQYKNGCVHRDLLLPGARVEGRAGGGPTGTRLHLHQALRPHDAGLTQAQVSDSAGSASLKCESGSCSSFTKPPGLHLKPPGLHFCERPRPSTALEPLKSF